MTATRRPVPVPTQDSDYFWRGCARRELWMQRCRTCSEVTWFPRGLCARCSGDGLDWVRLSGRGTLYSFSLVSRPPSDAFPPTYVLALVDLDEGPRMLVHLVGQQSAQIGRAVRVTFEQISDTIWLPVFTADDDIPTDSEEHHA